MENKATFTITTTDLSDGKPVFYKGCTELNVMSNSIGIAFRTRDGKRVAYSGVPYRFEEE